MASEIELLERAIVNAEKAGDADAAKILVSRYKELKGDMTKPPGMIKNPGGGYAIPSLETPDSGFGKTLAVSASRGTDKLIAGAKQAYNWLTGDEGDALAAQQTANDAGYASYQRNRPITTAVGETLPGVVLTAPIGGGAGLIGTTVRGLVAGAAPGLASYGTTEEKLQRGAGGALGGATGGAAMYGLARAVQPIGRQVRASVDATQAAKNIGYSMTPADRTGNPALQNLENYLARMPGSSQKMGDVRRANQEAINRTAARATGGSADSLDESVMNAAQARLVGEFDRLNSTATPKISSNDFLDDVAKIDATNRAAKSFASSDVDVLVEKALDLAADGNLTGPAYHSIRSALGQQASSTTNSQLKTALKKLQSALDEAADKSRSKADLAAIKEVRKQYADFKSLTKGMVIEGGDVSPRRLASVMKEKYGDQFSTGNVNSGLMDIARVGRGIAPHPNPNSGALGLSHAIASNPISAALAAGVNHGLASTYLSPLMQRYISSNMLPPIVERGLIRGGQGGGLLGAGTVQKYLE